MNTNHQRLPFFVSLLNVVSSYYYQCSESTQENFIKLGKALSFSVLVCGSVLAASFCEFWLDRNYWALPLVLIGTGLFYYILDLAIIMGDAARGTPSYYKLRLMIALILALFNSFLIDYYFFKDDIVAARAAETRHQQELIAEDYQYQINLKENRRAALLEEIDQKEARLSDQLDSLNAEASGMGGSGVKGISYIWIAKYKNYQADSVRVTALIESKRAESAQLAQAIQELKTQSEEDQAAVAVTISTGINQSLQLLHRIIWEDGKFTNIFMSVLILLVSMLLELVPLITKDFYDVEEYFDIATHQKEALTTNAGLKKQNIINKQAAILMNENAREMAAQGSASKLLQMTMELEHRKKVMQATESFMDELGSTEHRWQEKFPLLYDQYGKPVIEQSYRTLAMVNS